VASEYGWTHGTVELQPLNPDYRPIRITGNDTADLRIIGEFVRVIE